METRIVMAGQDMSPAALTRRAIQAWENGRADAAQEMLVAAVTADPEYERAWLWLAKIQPEPAERRYCLEKAVNINPTAATRRALTALRGVKAQVPPELADLEDPPAPDDLGAGRTKRSRRLLQRGRTRWLVAAGALLLVLAIAGGGLLAARTQPDDPIYIALVRDSNTTTDSSTVNDGIHQGVSLALQQANDQGGVDGREVKLLTYDDKGDTDIARTIAAKIIDENRTMLVIGHDSSRTSLATSPLYRDGGIPVITPTATADEVLDENPWFFRSVFSNREQGAKLAAYVHTVLGKNETSIVYDQTPYGRSLHKAFVSAFREHGKMNRQLAVPTDPRRMSAAVAQITRTLRQDDRNAPVILAMQSGPGRLLIPALRKAGVKTALIGGDALGADQFFENLAKTHRDMPDITKDVYAAAAMLPDAVTGRLLDWLDTFKRRYKVTPGWDAATAYDATTLALEGMRRGNLQYDPEDHYGDRRRIRDVIAGFDKPQNAVPGLSGPMYFDDTHSLVRPVVMGTGSGDRLVSAPTQLVPYSPAAGLDPEEEIADGRADQVGTALLSEQQIVQTGVNIIKISDLDSQEGTFNADFFLWLKYVGGEDATKLMFVNADDPELSVGEPLESKRVGNLNYRLYRVSGKFKSTFYFRDFPFDTQRLPIILQNKTLPASRVMYVTDRELQAQTKEQRLANAVDQGSRIDDDTPNWQARDLKFYQETVGSSANAGDPTLRGSKDVYYAQFVSDITVGRYVSRFLVKNLLPLALLVIATYVSLFFPFDQTATRVSFGVTGILSSAVMLNSVTGVLPEVSYTVAIEWAYYAFICLSAMCIIVAMLGDRLVRARRTAALHHLALSTRVGYPVALALVAVGYFAAFG